MESLGCAVLVTCISLEFQAKVLESADHVGGRARSEVFRGFRLDRGFQVRLTEYPEAEQVLNYEKLHLKCFEPGALVRYQGSFHRFVDPWRRPRHLLEYGLFHRSRTFR